MGPISRANLTGSNFTSVTYGWGSASWTNAYYYTDNVPDWHPEMDQAWRDSAGILAINPGDWNHDGVVDAADYTVWQDDGGDPIDYRTWKDHFGESIAQTGTKTGGWSERISRDSQTPVVV
jgi:hypothetical protein